MKKFNPKKFDIEEILSDSLSNGSNVVEVSIGNGIFKIFKFILLIIIAILIFRLISINILAGEKYSLLAYQNQNIQNYDPAPRGIIYDRFNQPLAQNQLIAYLYLNIPSMIRNNEEDSVKSLLVKVLGFSDSDISKLFDQINEDEKLNISQIIVFNNLTNDEIIQIKNANLQSLTIKNSYGREYPDAKIFSPVIGYVGLPAASDLAANSKLTNLDYVGKAGIEAYYNQQLSGTPGITIDFRNAYGQIIDSKQVQEAKPGSDLHLTIDSGLQKYFYDDLNNQLKALGRDVGFGVAMDPNTGAILSLVYIPSYDNNIMSSIGSNGQKAAILNSPTRDLFNRVVSGLYSPGSTIKPLEAIALLADKIISPEAQIFSPGYVEIPNPYHPDLPSRFADWRYQGWVNLYQAISWSSDVYFYSTVGGLPSNEIGVSFRGISPGFQPLGINRLSQWWRTFLLDKPTGIDLPGENVPTLPWPQTSTTSSPWLLGNTFNVSIGQGDLMVSPIRLIDDIAAIANGGIIYKPFIDADFNKPQIEGDLTAYSSEIKEVQKGMRLAVTDPKGTAYIMNDLPFEVAAKTGSAQIKNNLQENAFTVAYAPYKNPKIVILVFIENSLNGSLNTVPVAKDVLNWYYNNRLKNE